MSSLKVNIQRGFIWQGVSIVSSFLLVPSSIKYLGSDDYGLWIVLYSFLLILTSCDLGVPSSCRNLLTKFLTEKNKLESKKVISTSYFCVLTLSLVLFIGLYLSSKYIEVDVLKIFPMPLIISVLFITLLDYNLKLTLTVYTSDQKSYVIPLSTALINMSFLLIVTVLGLFYSEMNNKLYVFCMILPLCSLIINTIVTIRAYSGHLKSIRPNPKYIDRIYLRPILLSGIGFFIIQISMAILTQYSSILLYKYSSSEMVTDVSILDKYFGLISVVGSVLLFPFWSKFTQKQTEGDFDWIIKCIRKLELLFFVACILVIIMYLLFPWFLKVWMLDEAASISPYLCAAVALKYLAILLNSIYSYYLNGIGEIKIQIIFYALAAMLVVPMSKLLFFEFGAEGIISYSILVYLSLAIVQKSYASKILRYS